MKKKLVILLCTTLSFMLLTTNLKAMDTKITEEQIRAFIYTFDNIDTLVKYVRDLKDINNETSFSLYEIEKTGFAVTVKSTGNIVDIYYENIPDESLVYYVGPSQFIESIPSKSRFVIDNQKVKESTKNILKEKKGSFALETNQSKTRKIGGNSKPDVIKNGKEVGIADSRMDLFNGSYWVNKGNYCAAYSGAAMVTYMDKYFGGNYIKETTPISSSKGYADYIVGRFKQYITGSSTTFETIYALNNVMMADYPKGGKHGTTTATESTYKSKIKAGRPMIFFLSSWKNGPYGGHFVLAYKYVDYNGALWFKAYDNWAGDKNRGWINRNWIENGIFLS